MKTLDSAIRCHYILEILINYSNKDNVLSTNMIQDYLSQLYDVCFDRRTIKKDIDTLKQLNYDIVYIHKHGIQGVYLKNGQLTLAESKLLFDLLYSTQSISLSATNEIVKKLSTLVNKNTLSIIKKQQLINHNKASDTNIKNNITKISEAIASNNVISFKYFDYYNNQKHYRHDSKLYIGNPYIMYIRDDRYYLLLLLKDKVAINAYSLTTFRIDRMDSITKLDTTFKKEINNNEIEKRIDQSIYGIEGNSTLIRLSIDNQLLPTFYDKFNNIIIEKITSDKCIINFNVTVNKPFLAYLTTFNSNQITILSPDDVIEEFKQHLKSHLSKY